jgi:hypothetical protein
VSAVLNNVPGNVRYSTTAFIAQGLLAFTLPNAAALVICVHAGLIMENAIMDLLTWL